MNPLWTLKDSCICLFRNGVASINSNWMFSLMMRLFSSVVAHLHSHQQCMSVPVSVFTSLPAYIVFWLFDSSHPSGCEVVFYCGVDLFFSDDYCWISFVFFSHLYIFFGEMSIKMLCPILILLSCYYWIVSYLFFLVTSPLWDIRFARFFPSLWTGLSLSSCALWSTRILNLDEVQFIYFFFSFFAYDMHLVESID